MENNSIRIFITTDRDDQSVMFFVGVEKLRDFAIDRLDQGWETELTKEDLKDTNRMFLFLENDYGLDINEIARITAKDFDEKI